MRLFQIFAVGMILVLGIVGMSLKMAHTIMPTAPVSELTAQIDPYTDSILHVRLLSVGFDRIGKRPVSEDGNFIMRLYGAGGCGGGLMVLPLYRNAEAAHMLSGAYPDLLAWQLYFYDGQFSETFPALAYWIGKARFQLGFMFGRGGQSAAVMPVPIAFAGTNRCSRQLVQGVAH